MARLLIGGKSAKATARTLPSPPPDVSPKPFVDPAWGVVNADPFHVDLDKTPEYRAGYLAECGMWAAQFVEELATLARKRDRLDGKLRCPDLVDDPHRDDAVRTSLQMEADVIQRVRDLVMHEAEGDRLWQSLTPEQRAAKNADFMWATDATEDRLIGSTWFRLARSFAWPQGFRLDRLWFSGLPMVVVMDLRIFKVYAWNPNPRPEFFPGTANDPMPTDLARQIVNERGDPK